MDDEQGNGMDDVEVLDATVATGEHITEELTVAEEESQDIAVDPKALADLMPAFERLVRIGVYYPPGHPSCDEAAEAVRATIQRAAGKLPDVQIEVQGDALYVQGLDMDPELRGVAGFKQLLDEVGIVDLAIDPDIPAADLHCFVTRLLAIRQQVRCSRSFRRLEVDGLPPTVTVRDREFLARRREEEEAVYDESGGRQGPGLDSLMAALRGHGLDRRQLALCQRFLEALPQHLEQHRHGGGALPQATWEDVETLLLKAVRQRSFERASAAAQQLAIRRNLGSLVSLFETIGEDSAVQDWQEAVDLLLSLNQRPAEIDLGATKSVGYDDGEDDTDEIETALRQALAAVPATTASDPVLLLPADHLEELSVLVQVLQCEQPVSSLARIERRLCEILTAPLSADERRIIAGGARAILEQPPNDAAEVAVSLILDLVRPLAPSLPPKLVCALWGALPAERRAAVRPLAYNELLMADDVPADQYQALAEIAGSVSPDAVTGLAPRIDRLAALRDRRPSPAAARRLPVALFPHFAALFEASGKQPLGEWLLAALQQAPPCRTSAAVLPLLDRVRPAHREFLVAALRQDQAPASQAALQTGAATILTQELMALDRGRRDEEWVAGAVRLVHALALPQAESILDRIRNERRWLILPAWPGELRRLASALLDERQGRAA